MATLTKNSAASQAVIWMGCLLSFLGLTLEPTKTLFATGMTLVWSGAIQSYYGTVLEIGRTKRFWYIALGIPLSIGLAYVAYLNLRDCLPNWPWILTVVIATLGLQFLISLIGNKIWNHRHRIHENGTCRVCLSAPQHIDMQKSAAMSATICRTI